MSISSRSNSSSYGYTSSGSTSSEEDTYEYDTFETIQNVMKVFINPLLLTLPITNFYTIIFKRSLNFSVMFIVI